MKKELSPPQMIAIVAVFVVVVVAIGWMWLNYSPTPPAGKEGNLPSTRGGNGPTGPGGSQGGQPLVPGV